MKINFIKKQILIILLTLTSFVPTFGKVTFNLIFSDPEGIGFNAPNNQWMVNTAHEAMELIGGIIQQDAQVNIEIKSNYNIGYALSKPQYFLIEQDNLGQKAILAAHHKIIYENNINDGRIQGHIEFNPDKFRHTHSYLLRRTIIHELTHTLGFIPWKMEHNEYPSYNDYDKLLHDGELNFFLIGEDELTINPKFNCHSGLYACGPNIRKLNNEQSIKLHCPKTYKCGASFAHLDFEAHPFSIMNPCGHNRDYPIWNKYELGIMQDLGYKIDWDQYCSTVHQFYPSNLKVYVTGSELEGTGTHFKITGKHLPPFCFSDVNDKLDFTTMLGHENQITLVDNKNNADLFTFSIHDPKQNECIIGEKYFKIRYHYPFKYGKKQLYIRFIEEDPSYQTTDNFFDRLLTYFSND